jgi:hypothetical protein
MDAFARTKIVSAIVLNDRFMGIPGAASIVD